MYLKVCFQSTFLETLISQRIRDSNSAFAGVRTF